ncbi:MAG: IPT/TIG domain-containing protein, partial [Elusimicrobiota bacterium]
LSDEISLEAGDPVSNGAASGLAGLNYYVDVDPSLCAGIAPSTSSANGTCENPAYAGPFTLPAGEHIVYYTAEDNVGNIAPVKSALVSVGDGTIEQAAIVPSSGPIGLPFTITGEGFGTYSAGTTVVLIGGAAAPLTLWSSTTIKGTVPGALAAGEYPVVVMRGAELLAETSSFTVVMPALADIAPSSGPIGLPFTLTGSGFGNYLANYTRVLIGGATCPLTLWTDTQIKGTIPGTIAPGVHEVVVERALNGGLARSATVAFDLRDMEADWIAPSSGPIGMPFTINGAGFGNYLANYTTVLMGGATCPLTLWTDGQIKGTVPGGLATGQYPVLVERKTADGGVMHSPEMSFTVLAVDASSMTPVAGPIGMPFTIYGTGFGNYSAGWTRVLIGGTTAPLTLWTDGQIKGTVPGTIEPGAHEVVVERELNGGLVASQPLPFMLTVPDLAAVAPSSGPIGLPFTLTGSGFGNYVANSARVLIGGTTCPLTLWTDGQIKGTVPGTIAPGVHGVLVERVFNGGVARSQTLSFELADPVLATVSPSPAAVLAPFTLEGYNFGNYVAGRSEALIGGATAQLTLWTDTKIQGRLPALGAGEYPVLVRRSFNGGVAQSQASGMTIVEPSVSSMTPVSGQPGTTFSVFGAGFGPYDAAIARVLIGGLPGSLSSWTDGRINGTIPAELAVGTHTVIVSRGQYQSGALEFYVPDGGYSPSFVGPLTPAAAFRLGEVYVYPNPAKGGAAPVFHLEFGLADKVDLKVYSVAGSLVHERTLTGPPQVTSPVYAYEYAWDGHIASGVYYFTVEAERAGSKLKARGKFAVVR